MSFDQHLHTPRSMPFRFVRNDPRSADIPELSSERRRDAAFNQQVTELKCAPELHASRQLEQQGGRTYLFFILSGCLRHFHD